MGCIFKSNFLSAHKFRSKWLNFCDLRNPSSIVFWSLFADTFNYILSEHKQFFDRGVEFQNFRYFSIYLISAILASLCVSLLIIIKMIKCLHISVLFLMLSDCRKQITGLFSFFCILIHSCSLSLLFFSFLSFSPLLSSVTSN